jgi:arylsulfatase A-like enzyme
MALNTVDFKPTLLGLLGVRADKPSQGRDASSILRGRPVPENWNNLIFSRSPGKRTGSAWLMATDGRYKFVASPISPVWLIDLKNDPAEKTNLAGNPEMKPVVRRMAGALLDYAVTYNDPNLEQGKLRGSLDAAAGK